MADQTPPDAIQELPATYVATDTDRFTTERMDPEKRTTIISMSRDGASLREIASTLSVSEHTVMAVRKQEGIDWRTCTIRALEEAVPLGAARLREAFKTMDPEKLPIPWAIAVDKLLALKGEAQMIVEHRHNIDLSSLQTSLQVPDEINVTPELGSGLAATQETTSKPE